MRDDLCEVHDHQNLIAEGIHTQNTHAETNPPPRQISPDKAQGGRGDGGQNVAVGWAAAKRYLLYGHSCRRAGGGGRAEGFWFIMHICMLEKGRARGGGRQGGKKKKKKKGTLHASCIPSFPIHRVPRPLKIIIFQGLSLCQSLPHGEHAQRKRAVDKPRGGGFLHDAHMYMGAYRHSTRQERAGDTHTVSQV